MTDRTLISAAIRQARGDRQQLDLATNLEISTAVVAEVVRRGEMVVASQYQSLADELRSNQ